MDLLYNIYYYSNLNNYINNYAFLELSSITINNNIFNIFNVFFFFLWNFYKNINNFNNYYHLVDFFNTMYYPKFTILLKNDLNNLIHIYSNNIVYKFNINHIYNKYELLNIKKINNINVTLKNNILVYFFLLEGFNFNTNNFNLIDFIYDIDVLLIVLELFILLVYFSSYSNYIKVYKKLNIFYDDVIIFFQKNNISLAEFAVFFTLFLGFIFFDIFISFNEDDFLDSFVFFFIILFIFTFFFFFIFLDVQYFYLISSTSNGSYLIRSLIFDIINNLLCILRILICVVRYVSYDLQVEVLDLSFHYIDNNNDFIYYNVYNTNINNFSINNTFNINNINFVLMFKNFFFFFLNVYLDLVFIIIQFFLSLFKYYISIYLFWLIIDFFLFKSITFNEKK